MEFVSTGVFDYGHGAEVYLSFRWASCGLLFCRLHVLVSLLSSPSSSRDVAIAVLSLAIGSSLGDTQF
jgi:hypothetical protein